MGDSYRPEYGDPGPPGSRSFGNKTPMYHFQGNNAHQGQDRSRPSRPFTFRSSRPKIAERPLLSLRRGSSPDLVAPELGGDSTAKFRDMDNLTDSDAEDMDMSDAEAEGVATKRVKLDDGQPALKWSNPDPYTALPPAVEDATRKRTDVVKLIRKSRLATTSSDAKDNAQSSEDFISFDLDGFQPPPGAPSGPRGTPGVTNQGKRKRDLDDEEDGGRLNMIRGTAFHDNAAVISQWRAKDDPTPWYEGRLQPGLHHPLMSLHCEVVDFYDWVKPRDFEHIVRSELIQRLQRALGRMDPGCEIRPFGSFAAGLYLPTGDMDLVLLSSNYLSAKRSGRLYWSLPKRNFFFKVSDIIQRNNLCARPPVVIAKAKVPLVKFVDKATGIKVDLSFDNDTGIVANETFQRWKIEYPAMPVIVSVIKQFLMIRGLNDNAAGGLGGFSTICLVTSLIQMLPKQSGPINLGRILVEFFNLYGNLFNLKDVGIRMDPPGYFEKHGSKLFLYKKPKDDRLCIVDPNNPDNDISGGSQHVQIIFKAFALAHSKLKSNVEDIARGDVSMKSILGPIIGGNFEYYSTQREHLRTVYISTHPYSPLPMERPPPPPAIKASRASIPPPPPASTTALEIPPPPPAAKPSLKPDPRVTPVVASQHPLPQKPAFTDLSRPVSSAEGALTSTVPNAQRDRPSMLDGAISPSKTMPLGKTQLESESARPGTSNSSISLESSSRDVSQTGAGARLYVGNLAYATTEDQLRELFKDYQVASVETPVNPRSKRPVGYGFVELVSVDDIPLAISNLSGKELLSRKISVQQVKTTDAAHATAGTASIGRNNQRRGKQPSVVSISSDDENLDAENSTAASVLSFSSKISAKEKGLQRAQAFKRLRPDLKNIPGSLRELQACNLGGYPTWKHMVKDLQAREIILQRDGVIDPTLTPSIKPPRKARNKLRAERVRQLRPDLVNVPTKLGLAEAIKFAGYADAKSMEDDFLRREAAMNSKK